MEATSQKRVFDKRWLFIILLLVFVLLSAMILNNYHDNDSSRIVSNIDIDNGDQKINWDQYKTTYINLDQSYEITSAGIYHFNGTLEDGLISIKTDKAAPVKIILDNVTIRNSSGPSIACYEADDLVVELIGENSLEDSETYSSEFDADVTGVIYSKADLTFGGSGNLNIIANYNDGIVGKDDVKFNSGTFTITSADDGIRGKDSVYIINGNFNINSTADAIKSTNETDIGKGFVLIEDGNFAIKSSNAKGIKAINNVIFYSGSYNITTYDDSIHSDKYVGIIGGNFIISSDDDAIHANSELLIDSGKINIMKSYEGLEAQKVIINNGEISIRSSDDGVNAGGGADGSANNRPGAGMFEINEECIISINGGSIYINSSGDGIDSNGYVNINDGKIIVDGPVNSNNGALDASGGFRMFGGEIIAVGSNGMAETLGEDSSVHNISVFFASQQPANTLIEIKDSQDRTILSHTSVKAFSHIAAGTAQFNQGEKYTIYMNGKKYQEFTISSITTVIGTSMDHVMPSRNGSSF